MDDFTREFGKLEGDVEALKDQTKAVQDSLVRLETKHDAAFSEINIRLNEINSILARGQGGLKVAHALLAVFGSAVVGYFLHNPLIGR